MVTGFVMTQLLEKLLPTMCVCVTSAPRPPVEDYERNDGTEEKPYFMSDNLKKLLGVKNKFDRTDGTDGVQLAEVSGGDKLEPVDSSSNL